MIDPIDRNTALGITEECAKTLKWILSDEDLSESERKECEWKLSFAESVISDLKNVPSVMPEPEPCEDAVSRREAIDAVEHITSSMSICVNTDECHGMKRMQRQAVIKLTNLTSAQSDAVTASLEELINDYGEDGFFIVDGVNYQANELLNELKTNSSIGEKFRKQITKTIVQYFMKFGDGKRPLVEEPESCEDAVSRKAVEEMLKNGFPARGMWEIEGDVVKQTVCETLADALMDLGKLPSVTPKRKTMICGSCSHSDSEVLYVTNPPRIQCKKTGNLHFATDICDCDNMNNQHEISHSDKDAVSRKSILDKIEEVCFSKKQEWVDFRVSQGSNGQRDLITKFIESLPSIQQRPSISENPNKRKTGKWIHEIINDYTEKTYCSECGGPAPFVFVSDDYYGVHAHGEVRKTDFCPNCGAKMEVQGWLINMDILE